MKFIRRNLALKIHLENGKITFLFENKITRYIKLKCEVEFFDYNFFETPYNNGKKN
jgi:hypothetical protein